MKEKITQLPKNPNRLKKALREYDFSSSSVSKDAKILRMLAMIIGASENGISLLQLFRENAVSCAGTSRCDHQADTQVHQKKKNSTQDNDRYRVPRSQIALNSLFIGDQPSAPPPMHRDAGFSMATPSVNFYAMEALTSNRDTRNRGQACWMGRTTEFPTRIETPRNFQPPQRGFALGQLWWTGKCDVP